MVMKNLKSGRRLAVLALFAILAMSAFAFAAANVVPITNAGDGDEAVSGGTVTNVSYQVSNAQITGVTFNYTSTLAVDGDVTTQAAIHDGNGWVWSSNCVVGAVHTCTFNTAVDLLDAAEFRVVSFSNNP